MKSEIRELLSEVDSILKQIRSAIKLGNRPLAVELAAQRYQLLQQIEELERV
ncbi:MAG: hypothetical protein V4714_07070 [Bacteroidota bacterium]